MEDREVRLLASAGKKISSLCHQAPGPTTSLVLKATSIFLLALASLLWAGPEVEASWLIDARGFHVSAHGQVSCHDCHGAVAGKDLHPDPGDVNKQLRDFFHVYQCIDCHDEVPDHLDNGFHGSTKVTDREQYAYCIGCHNPHYQVRLTDPMGRFDPSRPRSSQCGACHEERTALPDPLPEDETCMGCHRSPEPDDPQKRQKISRFCFSCHGHTVKGGATPALPVFPYIDVSEYYRSSRHAAQVSCLACHPEAAGFSHARQSLGECGQCHLRHDEKVTHDTHLRVACQACHLPDIVPVRDLETTGVLWQVQRKPGAASRVHNVIRTRDESSCRRCHFSGNRLGAAAMVLPARSVICMPCHAATFSVGDTTTTLALLVFLLGFVSLTSVWLSGSLVEGNKRGILARTCKLTGIGLRSVFSLRIISIIKVWVLDALLQRRLYRQSRSRWIIHGLIFFPFLFRCLWGLIALFASLWTPEWAGAWTMLDKNNPTGAFLFDLSGIMTLAGVALALVRKTMRRSETLPGLPKQDWLAVSLFGAIILIGFVVEGMRIAMTESPVGAEYAFLGYAISRALTGPFRLTDFYGYIWYVHAILTGAFVAYLPFSRMFHMLAAPVVLVINTVVEEESQQQRDRQVVRGQ